MRSYLHALIATCLWITLAGCVQEMADQKRLESLEQAVPLAAAQDTHRVPPHTVPAGSATAPPDQLPSLDLSAEEATQLLLRGQQRFNIHCVPCHDWVGTGNGMVPRRGFPFPPSYHTDRLRAKPIEYFYHVATEGHGKMPAYGEMISEQDRWAIAAYVRALQLSQYADREQLSEADRRRLSQAEASAAETGSEP